SIPQPNPRGGRMKSFLLSLRRCLAVLAAPFCQKRGAVHPAAKPAGELHEYATHLYIISSGTRRSPLVTISLCMIVKDEEALLPRCLESIQGLVEEVIVVDTGSSDR